MNSLEINFPDCSSRKSYKIDESFVHADGSIAKKGSGEKRLYIGSDEKSLDDFFELSRRPTFFVTKSDLEQLGMDAIKELEFPRYEYGCDRDFVKSLICAALRKVQGLNVDEVTFMFRKTFDKSNRYFLVLNGDRITNKRYDFLWHLSLPRVTKFMFVKSTRNGCIFIQIKPRIYF